MAVSAHTDSPHVLRDYDHTRDSGFRWLLSSDDRASVSYEWRRQGDTVVLIRQVTRKARYRRDQVTLWEEVQAILPTSAVPECVRDLIAEAMA